MVSADVSGPGAEGLRGRRCLVTRATAGIGRATALSLARAGATVHATGRRRERLDGLADEAVRAGGPGVIHPLPFDVSDRRGCETALADPALQELDTLVYCATKYAVNALTEAIRLDVQGSGVRVMNVEPGMVETEFSEVRLGDREAAAKVYDGLTPLSAEDIAETILWMLSRPPHVNVQEVVVFPTAQSGVGPGKVHRRGS